MDTREEKSERRRTESRSSYWRTWSPAQIVAGILGLLLTVMGGVALARLLPAGSLTAETTTVFGVGHTPLMAIVALGLGLLYLAEAGTPHDVHPGMTSLGIIVLAFGLIVVIEPGAFDGALGLGETGGWFYTIIGLVSALTGIVSPTVVSRH